MARRLDIELTSVRDDGIWTWRASGAKEPRGAIDAKLLEDNAKVGDVVRVEASFDLDGITIVSVLPPRERAEPKDRIEIRTTPGDSTGSVTTELVAHRRGPSRDRTDREGTRPRRDEKRPRPGRPPRADGGPDAYRRERTTRQRSARPTPAPSDSERPSAPDRRERPAEKPRRTRPQRFTPGTKHRDEFLVGLAPDQRAVAEQLARGGMPAIRRAVAEARGTGEHGGEAMISLAEQLLPQVRRAMWLDRADAALAQLETIPLRDLRTTVVGATPRDEQGRAMLTTLREALGTRVAKIRTTWEEEIAHALESGRVLQALRLSSRAPDAGARLPSPLAKPLAEAASAALDGTTPPERWLALLEAAAASPVRLSVKPAGMPTDESGTLRQSTAAWAGRIPALAPMLGLALPPPPRPVRRAAPEHGRRQVQRQPMPESASAAPIAAGSEKSAERVGGDEKTATPDASPDPIDVLSSEELDRSPQVRELAGEVASAPIVENPVVDEPASDPVDEV